MAKSIYDIIKKQNGEKFAKSIRNYDSGIFDIKGIDEIVKFAGSEAEPIMNYLVSLKDVQIEEHGVHKSPFELLREAGYVSSYADTLEKQNNPDFQALYADGEEICTFRDNTRYQKYHIIHCIKENIKDIKRKDFPNPKRQDEYGTSAISIQIAKDGGFISIKNRYNHTVNACDNTFDSNPDNIIKGLSESLKHHFNVDFSSQKLSVPEGYTLMKGQILKYNYERSDVYFGKDFYATGGQVTPIDKLREIMIDTCILNLSTQEIKPPANDDSCKSFAKALKEEIESKKLLVKNNEQGNKCLFADGIEILEIENGNVVALNFPNVTEVNDYFMFENNYLKSVSMPNLQTMRNTCFKNLNSLTFFNAPNLQKMENNCFKNLYSLTFFNAPNLKIMGYECFHNVDSLTSFNAHSLEQIGSDCFENAVSLTSFNAHSLEKIGSDCFYNVYSLTYFEAPNLNHMGYDCFKNANALTSFNAPEYLIPDNIKEQIAKEKAKEAIKRVTNLLNKDKNKAKNDNKTNVPSTESKFNSFLISLKRKIFSK